MRFLRHDGIYRSDVSLLLVNPAQMPPPVGRPRCRAIARDGRSTPCPSSAMSSGRLFLDRGGRHQSPSPLHRHIQHKSLAFRRASEYHRTACSVLTVCVSRGDKRSGSQPHQDKSQRPVAWIVRRKETESRKSIDKAILGMVSESSGRNGSKRIGGPENVNPRGRALGSGVKAAWNVAIWPKRRNTLAG